MSSTSSAVRSAAGASAIFGQARIAEITQTLQILPHSPLIGRKVKGGNRELVIGQDARGYVALYRFVSDIDTVFVLAVRSQRESGYKKARNR